VATRTVAREAKRIADQQLNAGSAQAAEETASIIQSTEVALDLMARGNRQPQAGLRQALQSYEDF
jgi:hypothetical protein